MGGSVAATCPCGLSANSLVGGGMATFMTECYFPCSCSTCRDVVQVNLVDAERRCPLCETPDTVPFDSPSLIGSAGQRSVVEWNLEEQVGRRLVLTDGAYRCPKCQAMSLEFTDGGVLWN